MRGVYSKMHPLAHVSQHGNHMFCDKWPSIYALVVSRIGGHPGALLDVTALFSGIQDETEGCDRCHSSLSEWETQAKLKCLYIGTLSSYV
jgi:hypothetical protein